MRKEIIRRSEDGDEVYILVAYYQKVHFMWVSLQIGDKWFWDFIFYFLFFKDIFDSHSSYIG